MSGRAAVRPRRRHYVGVGIHIAEVDADYYEAFQLGPTERTLRTILLALVIGSAITVLLATGVGWWTSRRLLQPLGRITDAAGEIAAGDLDTRVAPEGDPDLDRLADSFNDMADAVQTRIEREARFASDVSHELRSPITALAAAAEVINGRRGELPDRTQQALDVVVGQVRRFDAMVIDLLELSRIDAGATDIHIEEVDIVALCRRIAARNGFADLPIDVAEPRRPVTAPAHGRGRQAALRADPRQPAGERRPPRRRPDAHLDRADRRPVPARRRRGRRTGRRSRRAGRASSSASPAAAPPATASGPVSAWPSSPSTPPPRAARRGSRTAPAAAPASSSASRRGRDEAAAGRS